MKNTFIISSLFVTFLNLSFAERVVEVVFVRTAEINGNNPSQATAEEFKKQIDAANLAYKGSGLQFKFDPISGFPPIVKNGWLHRDFVLKSGETLNSPEDKQPKVDSEVFTQMKNEYATKMYPGKLVVYSGAGTQIAYDKNTKKWVIGELEGAYSNMVDRYVRWHKYNDNRPYLFAHEGGHHLHLYHTFGYQPETVADWQKIVTDYLNNGGSEANILSLFDADGLADTSSDPGAGLFNLVNGQTCGNNGELKLEYNWKGQKKYVSFYPDRNNVMGYFFCDNFAPVLSPLQKKRAFTSVEFGNRNYLRNSVFNGISIPRYSPNIEVNSWGNNRIDLFAAGSDLKVQHKSWDGSSWYPSLEVQESWEPHLGEAVGVPSVTAWGVNRLDVFVRNINGSIKHQTWDGQKWYPSQTDWEDLGGTLAGDVKAVSWGNNRIDIVGRGYDNKVYHKAWDGKQWWPSITGWTKLGNESVTSDPVMVSWGKNRLDIFARGTAGNLLIKSWDGSRWWPSMEEWSDLGGQFPFGAKPAVTTWSAGRIDIVMRGMDNAIWHKAFSNGNWYPSVTGWNSLGGVVTSDPSMVSWGANRLDIVARGTDSKLYHKAWDGQNWWPSLTEWSSLGGYLLEGATPKIMSYKPGRLDIFIRNFDYEIQHKAYENQWYPSVQTWEKIGKYID